MATINYNDVPAGRWPFGKTDYDAMYRSAYDQMEYERRERQRIAEDEVRKTLQGAKDAIAASRRQYADGTVADGQGERYVYTNKTIDQMTDDQIDRLRVAVGKERLRRERVKMEGADKARREQRAAFPVNTVVQNKPAKSKWYGRTTKENIGVIRGVVVKQIDDTRREVIVTDRLDSHKYSPKDHQIGHRLTFTIDQLEAVQSV